MKILHPTDFSEGADQARAEAIRLARAAGGEVVLLHVLEQAPFIGEGLAGPQMQQIYDAHRQWAEEQLDERVAETEAAGVRARRSLRLGSPFEQIVQAAEDERVDLIVMGTHGRGGLRRFLLGSVADRVVRSAACPVVTVRTARSASAGGAPEGGPAGGGTPS